MPQDPTRSSNTVDSRKTLFVSSGRLVHTRSVTLPEFPCLMDTSPLDTRSLPPYPRSRSVWVLRAPNYRRTPDSFKPRHRGRMGWSPGSPSEEVFSVVGLYDLLPVKRTTTSYRSVSFGTSFQTRRSPKGRTVLTHDPPYHRLLQSRHWDSSRNDNVPYS